MNRRDALRLLAYTGVNLTNLGAAASFLSGCARRDFNPVPIRKDRYGVMILVDGLRASVFREMLDSGALPNIERELVGRGTTVETCVSTFPSTTGPAHLPFITGVMPGYNNCPGIRWVDRTHRKIRDYCTLESILINSDFPRSNHTIYEVLYDSRTVCIYDFVSRGASDKFTVPIDTLWFMVTGGKDIWRRMDEDAADAFRKAYLKDGTVPTFTFVWMPAIDHLAHFHGSQHQMIYDRAKDVDDHVGKIVETIKEVGVYDKTMMALIVDHGLRDTQQHVNLSEVLERADLSVMGDLDEDDEFNSLYQHNAVRSVSGNAFALMYFAKVQQERLGMKRYAWETPPTYLELREFPNGSGSADILELLREESGIELVMASEGRNRIHVLSRDAESVIERDYTSLKYTPVQGDPLGYTGDPEAGLLVNGLYHDKDDWFMATRNTRYPDGMFQIAQLFDSERCGDVVVTASDGWDLMDQKHIASHGGMDVHQIVVPCVVAGPGVRQGSIPIARTVDIYPTFLKHMGLPRYDGEVLDVFI
jgi:arylsulfatase A-like enzyme